MSKYSSRLAERFSGITPDDFAGDVEYGRWYGLFKCRRADVILTEDSQGFVDAEVYSHAEALPEWDRITEEVNNWFISED